MSTVRLSGKGQVVIPENIRERHRWREGQELEVIDTDDGLVLREKRPFRPSTIDEVAGCLKYSGRKKSLADMEEAIGVGAKKAARNGRR